MRSSTGGPALASVKFSRIIFEPAARDDYRYWQNANMHQLDSIEDTIDSIMREPFLGLTCDRHPSTYDGLWSRPMSREHSLVYSVRDDTLIIVRCRDRNVS